MPGRPTPELHVRHVLATLENRYGKAAGYMDDFWFSDEAKPADPTTLQAVLRELRDGILDAHVEPVLYEGDRDPSKAAAAYRAPTYVFDETHGAKTPTLADIEITVQCSNWDHLYALQRDLLQVLSGDGRVYSIAGPNEDRIPGQGNEAGLYVRSYNVEVKF